MRDRIVRQRQIATAERYVWQVSSFVVIALYTLVTITPLIWMVLLSLRPHAEIIRNIFALPRSLYLQNFVIAWNVGNLGQYILNSIFYSVVATVITVYLALSTGFALTKFPYKANKTIYTLYIMGLLITVHAVLVPLFLLESWLNIDNTRIGVILPYVAFGMPFAVYLATAYIKHIPDALIESALIDGSNYIGIFHRLIMPMSRPVVVTLLIFVFLSNWNEFVFVFVLTSDAALRSLPVGVSAFAGGRARDFGLLFAALLISTVPMLVFYFFFHRQITRGFAAGAVKG